MIRPDAPRAVAVVGVAAAIAVAIAAAGAQLASACDGHAFVRVAIDPLPEALRGMRIEFHQTMGPQLVIDNPTARRVEILDDGGVAFARVGRGGVEGNVAAAAWYTTFGPAAVVPASATPGAAARWVRASDGSSFGWFEPRVDPSKAALPQSVIEAGRPAELGSWSLPLRVDGAPIALRGRFRYAPPADGAFHTVLTSPRWIADRVSVRVLPGRVPGLLVVNSGPVPLLILGTESEPFLRIGPQGVEANVVSPTWRVSGRSGGVANLTDAAATPRWQRVSTASRYSWLETRAAESERNERHRSWRVPVRIGGELVFITGETTWRSSDGSAAAN